MTTETPTKRQIALASMVVLRTDRPTKRQIALASMVVLRTDRPTGQCAAWMEAADRVCGKDATAPWLCPRHVKVAEKRWAKRLASAS